MGMVDVLSNDYVQENCKKNDEVCMYIRKTSLKDIHGNTFKIWICKCEEEMCATCIPTFKSDR